ncbi:MAG: NAD(P)-dependent alcohol dehydrogenase [Chloroflexota bacterium]
MKAIVFVSYGSPDGLQLQEVAKPTPKDNQLLIRIDATTVTTGDCEIRSLRMPLWLRLPIRLLLGYRKPKRNTILGTEFAGEIEAVGKTVTRFKPGDPVFGSAGLGFGTNAEYRCLPESGFIAIKPANMSSEEATTVPFGARDALHFLRKGNIQPGQKVLINGAGGSIGTYAVELAKYFGAEVTGVDSTGKLDTVRSIGADHLIDYAQEDFTQNGLIYDVIFDTVGKSSFSGSLKSLKPNGTYLLANPSLSQMARAGWASRRSGRNVIAGAASIQTEDLIFLKGLIEAGKLKAVIDRRYPLEQIAEAHRYVDTGQKIGNVVITIAHNNR